MEPKKFTWPFSSIYNTFANKFSEYYRDAVGRMGISGYIERNPKKNYSLLDVAGGGGQFAMEISKMYPQVSNLVTMDITKSMASLAGKNIEGAYLSGKIKSIMGDGQEMPFEDGKFDIVVNLFSIHHFLFPLRAIMEMHRVLKPGGYMAILDGYGKPPLSLLINSTRQLGAPPITAYLLWLSSKDLLEYYEIEKIFKAAQLEYKYLKIKKDPDDPIVIASGLKND